MTKSLTPQLTPAQAGALLGVTVQRISQLKKDGMPLEAGPFGVWWREREGTASARLDAQAERARCDFHRANLLALEQGEAERRLIPAAEVEQTIAVAFAAIAQDLHAIPDNLERRHGTPPEVAERVEMALHEAMTALADRLAALAPPMAEQAGA